MAIVFGVWFIGIVGYVGIEPTLEALLLCYEDMYRYRSWSAKQCPGSEFVFVFERRFECLTPWRWDVKGGGHWWATRDLLTATG
jgi:hypothetical protein